jgi:hypothetical protein
MTSQLPFFLGVDFHTMATKNIGNFLFINVNLEITKILNEFFKSKIKILIKKTTPLSI